MDDFTQFNAFQLIYALDFGYLSQEIFSGLDQRGKTATKCLGGLIRQLGVSDFRGLKFNQRDDSFNESEPLTRSGSPPNRERL